MKEPVLCCQLAGVQPPPSALEHSSLTPAADDAALGSPPVVPSPIKKREKMPLPPEADMMVACHHSKKYICINSSNSVWDMYVPNAAVGRADSNELRASVLFLVLEPLPQHEDSRRRRSPYFLPSIQLPHSCAGRHHRARRQCRNGSKIPPVWYQGIEKIELIELLLNVDWFQAFVETNRSIKWCPLPGCGRAVRLPPEQYESSQTQTNGALSTSHAVDCGNGHFFCWECLGEAHAPCG